MHFWQKGKDFLTGLFFTWRKYKKKSRPSRERQLYEMSLLSDSNQRPRDYKSRARSSPGGFEGSWPYGTYPYFKYLAIPELSARYFLIAGAKVSVFFESAIPFDKKMKKI